MSEFLNVGTMPDTPVAIIDAARRRTPSAAPWSRKCSRDRCPRPIAHTAMRRHRQPRRHRRHRPR